MFTRPTLWSLLSRFCESHTKEVAESLLEAAQLGSFAAPVQLSQSFVILASLVLLFKAVSVCLLRPACGVLLMKPGGHRFHEGRTCLQNWHAAATYPKQLHCRAA